MFRKAAIAVMFMVLGYGFVAHNEIATILGTFALISAFTYIAIDAAFDEAWDRR